MFKNLRIVYITTKNREEAVRIGKDLVEKQYAACVNIIDGMESIYRWKDEVVTDKECILIAKTTYSNVNRLTRRVKELHSYEVPCVITFNVSEQEGNHEYLDWLVESVRPPIPASVEFSNKPE
jgi:periplasmic divalent cation tolerance protein